MNAPNDFKFPALKDPSLFRTESYINGEWVAADSGMRFDVDNPADGSNWELLCVYCHDNEHSRYIDQNDLNLGQRTEKAATSNPFAGLSELLAAKSKPR